MPGLKSRRGETAAPAKRLRVAMGGRRPLHHPPPPRAFCAAPNIGVGSFYIRTRISPGLYRVLAAIEWDRKKRTPASEWFGGCHASPVVLAASGRGCCYLSY